MTLADVVLTIKTKKNRIEFHQTFLSICDESPASKPKVNNPNLFSNHILDRIY